MEFVGVIHDFIQTMDGLGSFNMLVHFVMGVFCGFFCGAFRPEIAFWGATAVGFGKETLDYVKHTHESSSFYFLTDPKYGLYDGMEDLLLWMIGGYIAYQVWKRTLQAVQSKNVAALSSVALGMKNRANASTKIEVYLPHKNAAVTLGDCVHSAFENRGRMEKI